MRTRHTFVATGLVALLALAGVTAAIAADPAGDPPPKIAFLANGIVPADALAAGPIAGQLGAPVFTTQPDNLSTPAAEGLDAANPELVIVLGGPVAIQDGVLAQVSAATGLPILDPDSRPDSGIVRAAGEDRFETAQIVAQLLGDYDPAYLGVDLKADDADLLDGKDSSAFQPAGNYLGKNQKAADSDKLDGKDSTAFLGATAQAADSDKLDGKDSSAYVESMWAFVDSSGALVRGVNVDSTSKDAGAGTYRVNFTSDVSACAFIGTAANPSSAPETVNVGIQGSPGTTANQVFVQTSNDTGSAVDSGFMLVIVC